MGILLRRLGKFHLFLSLGMLLPLLVLPVAAKDKGDRLEIREKRTPLQRFFQNPDGTKTTEINLGGSVFQGSEGKWEETAAEVKLKDKTGKILAARAGGKTLQVRGARFQTFAGKTTGPVRFQVRDDCWVEYTLVGGKKNPAATKLNRLIYAEVAADTDLEYIVTANTLKENLVLKSSQAPASFAFRLEMAGVTPRAENDGTIGFYNLQTGVKEFFIAKPVMHDSAKHGDTKPVTYCDRIQVTLTRQEDDWLLTLTPDPVWLKDPTRVYPVYLDPTTVLSKLFEDAMVQEKYPNTNYGRYEWLNSGYTPYNGTQNLLYKWDLSLLPASSEITQAILELKVNYTSGDAGSHTINRITSPWTEETVTWANKPTYAATPLAARVSNGKIQWDITELICGWLRGDYPNFGVYISNDITPGSSVYRYFGVYAKEYCENYGGEIAAKLSITYSSPVSAVVAWPREGEAITTASPELRWEYSSSANYSQTHFQVQVSAQGDFAHLAFDSGEIASAAPAYQILPLPEGKWYWRVRVKNEAGWSEWSTTSFILDWTPPSAVTLTIDPWGSWGHDAYLCWQEGQDDLAGVKGYQVQCSTSADFSRGLREGLVQGVMNTWYSFDQLFEGITYYYRIRAIDHAGNSGPWSNVVSATQKPWEYNWWFPGWRFRQEIAVINPCAWEKKNEPVVVTIVAEQVKAGGADLRLADETGRTVPFKIIAADDAAHAYTLAFETNIWAQGTRFYAVFFGNPEATSVSVTLPETDYTLGGENEYYRWYRNPSRKWDVVPGGTPLFALVDDSGSNYTLPFSLRFWDREVNSLFVSSNTYLDLGESSYWNPIVPEPNAGNLIRVDNRDQVTAASVNSQPDFVEFNWDGYIYAEPTQPVQNAVRLYRDHKIVMAVEQAYGGLTQIETPQGVIGPQGENPANYATLFIYRPVKTQLGPILDYQTLPSVQAIYPTDNLRVGRANLTLRWRYSDPAGLPQRYFWIDISDQPDFSTYVGGTWWWVEASEPSWQVDYLPELSGTYYWRVRANNGTWWSPWSEGQFYLDYNWVGPVVQALAPLNPERVGESNLPLLQWQYTDPANLPQAHFWVEISDRADFGTLVGGTGEAVASSATSWQVTSLAGEGGHYYWRVKADNGTVCSAWSNVGRFYFDKQAPKGSVKINDGAETTSTLSVTLHLNARDLNPDGTSDASNVAEVGISNDGNAWYWTAYRETLNWNLGDDLFGGNQEFGLKTVKVYFKDGCGNLSELISASIRYTPPSLALRAQADTMVSSGSPTVNYGQSHYLYSGYSASTNSGTQNLLYRWDLRALPPESEILQATLELPLAWISGDPGPQTVNRIITDWDEKTVTWATKPEFTTPTSVASVNGGKIQWDVTALVQGWVNGAYPNYGVYITNLVTPGPSVYKYFAVYAQEYFANYGEASPLHLVITYRARVSAVAAWPTQGEAIAFANPEVRWTYFSSANYPQTHFQIQVSAQSDFANLAFASGELAGANTVYLLPTLGEGQWYWRVRVKNEAGWSGWSSATFIIDKTPPSAPFLYEIDPWWYGAWGHYGEIYWQPAEDNGGIKGYRVQVSTSADFSTGVSEVRVFGALNTWASFSNLFAGVTYYYRVGAIDRAGNSGPWSNVVSATQKSWDYDWQLSGWQYRQEIAIANPCAWEKKNEPVLVTLTADQIQPGGADLRLVDEAGKAIPFKIVKADELTHSYTLAFEVNLWAQETRFVSLYYGNPGATSVSATLPETDYLFGGSNAFYSWYLNPSRKWDATPDGTPLFPSSDEAGADYTLPFTFRFWGKTVSSLQVNSNAYLDLGDSFAWNSTVPELQTGNFIRVDNSDQVTAAYVRPQTDYVEFIWDGYTTDNPNVSAQKAARVYRDHKLYLTLDQNLGGLTQIEAPEGVIKPASENITEHALIFVYQPVTTNLGPRSDFTAIPTVRVLTPRAREKVTQLPLLQWQYTDPRGLPQCYFWLEISDRPDFSHVVGGTWWFYPSSTPSWQVDFLPEAGGTYYWRVKVNNGSWWSDWSDVGSFTLAVPVKKQFLYDRHGNLRKVEKRP